MTTLQVGSGLALKNIAYLTDFSDSSARALPFAIALAREYGARIHALHVLTMEPYVYMAEGLAVAASEEREQFALSRMRQLDAALGEVPHNLLLKRGVEVWATVERTLNDENIGLIVLGTRGRTGAAKLFLGSVAEEIFRRAHVPVLTIGPMMAGKNQSPAQFHKILFATDFKPESLAAASTAVSLVQENEAQLYLLHAIRYPERRKEKEKTAEDLSIADAMHRLNELVPEDAELLYRPRAIVEFGDPADTILQAAAQREADLIVLGLRRGVGHLGATTHMGWTTAHRVVAHASCPVLTVRS
jgi:nucleotide-binding universal stress UspA family protein